MKGEGGGESAILTAIDDKCINYTQGSPDKNPRDFIWHGGLPGDYFSRFSIGQ